MNPKLPADEKCVPVGLSIPPPVRAKAKQAAKADGRSFSRWVLMLIERELEQSGRADLRVAEQAPTYAASGTKKIKDAIAKKKSSGDK
jgi:hypothetical protein